MGCSLSSPRYAPHPSTSTGCDLDLSPLLVLTTPAARHLLNAAFDGDVARVKKWARRLTMSGKGLEAAAVAICDLARHGFLHFAAAMGQEKMCQLLIQHHKHGVNSSDRNGATPLIFAIKGMQSASVVSILLDSGADPNKADRSGLTALHIATEQDSHEIMEELLIRGAYVDPISQYGETPLHMAARNGNSRILKLLLEHNADFEQMARLLYTPLSVALFGRSSDCMKLLVEDGRTPIEIAAFEGSVDRINSGSMMRAVGNAAFWKKDYALASNLHMHDSFVSDEEKERDEKLMAHFHSMLSSLFSVIFPAMMALFVADTEVCAFVKTIMLTIFLMTGAIAIFGIIISTSIAERKWVPVASAITLYITLFSLGLFHFSLGLLYPKIQNLQSNVSFYEDGYSLLNIGVFIGSSTVIIFLWGFIHQTPEEAVTDKTCVIAVVKKDSVNIRK
uniref:Uncharacterized protein n=1 Tax=Leersia perrieri TaxID=77586 RepID=A0A0D9XBY7_9ORYZ